MFKNKNHSLNELNGLIYDCLKYPKVEVVRLQQANGAWGVGGFVLIHTRNLKNVLFKKKYIYIC